MKLLETERLAEVQFLFDSCRFGSQSNFLNNSNKNCDWLISACFIRVQCTADTTFARFENSAKGLGKLLDSLVLTVLCSVLKHLGSDRALQKEGKNTRLRLVFSPTLLSCSTASCVLYKRTEHSRGSFITLSEYITITPTRLCLGI